MRDYNPILDHEFTRIGKLPRKPGKGVTVSGVTVAQYADDAELVLEMQGFENIVNLHRDGADMPYQPLFRAERGGKTCSICMPEELYFLVDLPALTEEQCEACDSYGDDEVYYAALVAMGKSVYMHRAFLVKNEQGWIGERSEVAQFLPEKKRLAHCIYSPLMGDCSTLKFYHLMLPYIREYGEDARLYVGGINGGNQLAEPGFTVQRCGVLPTVAVLLHRMPEHELPSARMFFYYEHRYPIELELCSSAADVNNDEQLQIVAELATAWGTRLYAECLETAALPTLLPRGRHYICSLSMVALEAQVSSTKRGGKLRRKIEQKSGKAMASIEGEVVGVYDATFYLQSIIIAMVRFADEADDAVVAVALGMEVLQGNYPREGSIIKCYGIMCVVPKRLVETTPESSLLRRAWCSRNARNAYAEALNISMAHAAAVAAFAAGDRVARNMGDISQGHEVITVRHTGTDREARVRVLTHAPGGAAPAPVAPAGDGALYTCSVGLTYHPERHTYKADLRVEPPCPGVKNCCVELPEPETPVLLRDEHAAAVLLRRMLSTYPEPRDILRMGQGLCEDVSCDTPYAPQPTIGKAPCMMQLAAIRKNERCSYATGRLVSSGGGARRCMAIMEGEQVRHVALFALRAGRIERVEIQPVGKEARFVPDRAEGASDSEWAALMTAVKAGDSEAVCALICAGANVHAALPDGTSALHMAVRTGNAAIIRSLLEAGADPNAPDDRGLSPLRLMEEEWWRRDLLRAMAEAGGKPSCADFAAGGRLTAAVNSGSAVRVAELLLDGVNPNVRVRSAAHYRMPAVQLARLLGHADIEYMLVKAGARMPEATEETRNRKEM